ncbi:MAG: hypothetical protein WDM70_11150 [Nitrosomonadales bacterium]
MKQNKIGLTRVCTNIYRPDQTTVQPRSILLNLFRLLHQNVVVLQKYFSHPLG